ncbi:hypothetical protein RTM1035_11180 [Roseovarius sp. TM1035]|uniref:hypothetical protein n=1 Tax=Roseovarius sp. TM1035 TaxID=391613 RepID=UPI0001556B8A|nr:hypothetical protein [Roseovarius sp. TM1035]AWZ22292.1 Hypothetical protein RAK1035_3585 [Roseovarius sp. AK1035]EDM30567.1 hypothetical protein RTM1035_11180 [Roseovarius sp. TM1035]
MLDGITNTQNFNFRDYMAMPSGTDFECFLGTLNDHGISVDLKTDSFFEDEENALFNMSELGGHLEFFARFLQAKAKGFEALRDEGVAAIFATSEYSAPVSISSSGGCDISGSWCRKDGVLYIVHNDMIDTHAASAARTMRGRNKADQQTAAFWMKEMAERKI